MTSSRGQSSSSLPQCGFGDDYNFDTLVGSNPFLFRVYTPKERSPFSDDTEPYFVAPKFDEFYARSPVDLPKLSFSETLVGTYSDVAKHMDWTTRAKSAYISTSFSFSWAIWEAVKRFHTGMKKDVEIAIIDARALGGRAATAVQLLMKSNEQERDDQFWKWHKFAKDSQSVLVYAMVPRPAVLASVPLLQVLRRMPSYFLSTEPLIAGNPLTQVAWDYTSRKASYHHFCQDMTKAFLSLPPEFRLRDSTTGAVRLALALLHPLFHQLSKEGFKTAVDQLQALAFTIAEWPNRAWVTSQPEIRRIIESMIIALAEEHLCRTKGIESEEISRLRVVISGLEHALEIHNPRLSTVVPEPLESTSDSEDEDSEEEEQTLVASDLSVVEKILTPLQTSIPIAPRAPIFQTPITPPESPRNSVLLPPVSFTISAKQDESTLVPSEESLDVEQQEPTVSSVGSTVKTSLPLGLPSVLPSPPPTPPARIPVFSLPPFPVLSPVVESEREGEEEGQEGDEEHEEQHAVTVPQEPLPVVHERLQSIPEEQTDEEETNSIQDELREPETWKEEHNHTVENPQSQVEPIKEANVDALVESQEEEGVEEDMIDDDKTDIDVEEANDHQTGLKPTPVDYAITGRQSPPLVAWVPRGPSGLLSPRLSVSSIDTLICESMEYPSKRGSVSYPEPFSFLRRLSSVTAVDGHFHSRTVSFSGVSAITMSDHVSEAPSEQVSEPDSIEAALNIPLPPSPTLSTLSSLSSHSLSPVDSVPPLEEEGVSPTLSEDSGSIIIPPKAGLSLLSPIDSEDDDIGYDNRASLVAETTSYLVTGFLFGAFITLILFSTQRRALLYIT